MTLTVNLVAIDTESDALLLRSVIESYGGRVNLLPVAIPSQLVDALSGDDEADVILICGHGGEDASTGEHGILIPELAEDLYAGEPFREALTAAHVRELVHLSGQAVISCGCSTGRPEMAEAFLSAGASAFVGPVDDEDAKACVQFVITLAYGLLAQEIPLADAVERARVDPESALFRLYE